MFKKDFVTLINIYKEDPKNKKALDSIRKYMLTNVYYIENIEEYIDYFQEQAEALQDDIGYALSCVMRFWINHEYDLEKANEFNRKALNIYHTFDDYRYQVGYLSAVNNEFIYNNYKGNLLENYKIITKVKEICNELSDPTYYISFALNSVYLLCNLTLYDKALQVINEMKSQKIFLSPSNIANMNNVEVKILVYNGLYEEALEKAKENIEYNSIHKVFFEALPYRTLLSIYTHTNNVEKATEVANKILSLISDISVTIDFAELYFELGRYYRMIGDFKNAYKYFLNAYKFRSGVIGEQLPFLTETSIIFKKANDMNNYLECVEEKYHFGMKVNQVLRYIIKNNDVNQVENLADFGYKYLVSKLGDLTNFVNEISTINSYDDLKNIVAAKVPSILNLSSASVILTNDIDGFKEDVISHCDFKSKDTVHLVDLDIPEEYKKNTTDIIIIALKKNENEIFGYLVLKYINDSTNKTERINYFGGIIKEILTLRVVNLVEYNNVLIMYNKDQLTKCYNRYGLNEILNKHFKTSEDPLYYVMMDIDYFKKINDTYGHSCGDLILAKFGELLIKYFGDKNVARIGGEEFVALVDINKNIEKVLDEFVEIINDTSVDYNKMNIKFTVSIGVSKINCADIDEAAKEADRKLYKVKKAGKNHFVI